MQILLISPRLLLRFLHCIVNWLKAADHVYRVLAWLSNSLIFANILNFTKFFEFYDFTIFYELF